MNKRNFEKKEKCKVYSNEKKEKCKVYSNFSLLKTGVKKYQPNLSKDFIKILFYKDFWIKSDQ